MVVTDFISIHHTYDLPILWGHSLHTGPSIILTAVPMSSFAAQSDEKSASGGWSEKDGYYVDASSSSADLGFSTRGVPVASSPEVHTGEVQNTYGGHDVLMERVHGYTAWEGKYHYTRARFESQLGSGVVGDSNRVYGTNVTNAYGGWVTDRWGYVAVTNWGS
ncbi:hypothetical protein [Paenibacillus stellifer]|uniref:hypothetical protein n=1 Tax=Paenibacillus stellifer TaxID=169760 RepID=UPI0012EE4D6C|nr:hypothetical protein [Paenibacillus stellifer]